MIRTFIAVELPLDLKNVIADFQRSIKTENFPVKWVKPENLHLTLKFIGDIDQQTADLMKQKMEEMPPVHNAFETVVSGTGVFPNIKKPRVFWSGITHGAEELAELAKKVDNFTAGFNIEKEKRSFKPHLTLGRMKNPKFIRGLENFISPDILYAGTFVVDKLILMKSDLKPTGAEYTPLARHMLAE